jgi:peptidoglycan/xylan/chitin deacetylase (PgdA/CDA1 family)
MSGPLLRRIKIEYDAPVSAGRLYPGNRRAAACISIDFDVTVADRLRANRAGTTALVALSEKYDVPLTWAICGMTADEDRDCFQRILDSRVRHELGVHTYSHLDALKCGAEEFERDIQRCVDTLGLDSFPSAFIFPWNRENHFDVLRRMGFKAYRGKERAVGAPTLREGLYNIRPVYYVDQKSFEAQSLINKYADLCASASSVFHLWTHPWSIVMKDGGGPMTQTLEPVFRHLGEMRDRGDLALCTMGELAEHFGASGASKSGA